MRYTMVFALTPDLRNVLLLRKPENHHNNLFAGKWTVPGGRIELGECDHRSAVREFKEETGIEISPATLRRVAVFQCNCDPTEDEHEIVVYVTTIIESCMDKALGEDDEPVMCFFVEDLPSNLIWSTEPLLGLAIGRITQPK